MHQMENQSSDGTQLLESCGTMPEKELGNLQAQKPDSKNGIHASQFSESSQAIKQEPYDLLLRQNAQAKSQEEERTALCRSAKVSDHSDLNPLLPAQDFDQNQVPHIMRDEKVLKKFRLRQSVDTVAHNLGLESEIGNLPKSTKIEPGNFQLMESPDCVVRASEMCEGRTFSVMKETDTEILIPEAGSGELPPSRSHEQKLTHDSTRPEEALGDAGSGELPPSRSHEQKLTHDSTKPDKALERSQQRQNLDCGDCNLQCGHENIVSNLTEILSIMPKDEPESNNLLSRHCLDNGNNELVTIGEKCNSMKRERVSENLLQVHNLSVQETVSICDQGSFTKKAEKLQPRRNPDPGGQGPQSDAESVASKILEKGVDDGYNWRKYGQKFVKGKEFIRSYYKCTYPHCPAKRQVERSHHSYVTDVHYLGKHQHPKPQSHQVASGLQTRIAEMSIATASNGSAERNFGGGTVLQCIEPAQRPQPSTVSRGTDDNDYSPDTKRRKTGTSVAGDTLLNKPHYESRHVVQTMSDVDLVNDGYRWRKYGRKLVKGNPNPRSYYRCSNAGCPVKKHVERSSHDPKVVITAYEGQHDHDMPGFRAGNQNASACGDADIMVTTTASKSKPEENKSVGLENGCSS